MNMLEIDSRGLRRARTRSLIAIGGLVKKSGLLETFQIEVELDLQKDPEMKEPIAALFKGFLVMDEMVRSGDVNLKVWAVQGLEKFAEQKSP